MAVKEKRQNNQVWLQEAQLQLKRIEVNIEYDEKAEKLGEKNFETVFGCGSQNAAAYCKNIYNIKILQKESKK